MKEWKQNISDEKSIRFSFNGEFLTFYCGSRKIPIPAIGEKWINEYQFGFEFIDMLPKRIYQEKDGLLIIDDGYLKIGAAEILIHAVGNNTLSNYWNVIIRTSRLVVRIDFIH